MATRPMLRASWLAIACVVAASAISVSSLTGALWGIPNPGLNMQADGVVTDIFPGGPLWRNGVRAGQPLLGIDSGDREEDWQITVDMGVVTTVTESWMTQGLRSTIPVALIGALVAVLAYLVLAFSPAGAVALAAVAAVLAERSSMAAGVPATSSAIAALALVAPALWFLGWGGHRRWSAFAVAIVGVVAVAWLVSRFSSPATWETLEPVRVGLTYGGLVALILVAGSREIHAVAGGYDRRRRTDIAVLAGTAIGATLMLQAQAQLVPVLIVALLVVLGYPILRGRLWAVIDRLGVGTLRQQASVQATEDERARVAREIHDTAIQELAAVASSIEGSAGSDPATALRLRDIADRLRAITNELRSAELEDLGLGGALAALVAREDGHGDMSVRLDLADETSPTDRSGIPDDVALALYRIAQEAISNALRHSGGSEVVVTARITAGRIDLVVADDGVGLDRVALDSASRLGHMGLASMRQRASLVGATFEIGSNEPGVRITVGWLR